MTGDDRGYPKPLYADEDEDQTEVRLPSFPAPFAPTPSVVPPPPRPLGRSASSGPPPRPPRPPQHTLGYVPRNESTPPAPPVDGRASQPTELGAFYGEPNQRASDESVDLYRRVSQVDRDEALRAPPAIGDDFAQLQPDEPAQFAMPDTGSATSRAGFGTASSLPGRAVLAEPRQRANDSIWLYVVVFLGAVSLVVSGGLLFFHFVRQPVAPTPTASKPSTSARPNQVAAPSGVESARPALATSSSTIATAAPTPTTSASAKADAADPKFEDARNALAKLQTGVQRCVEDHIGVLPGTSKKVPGAFRMFKDGEYKSPAFIWRTPVFHCTQFSLDEPQTFIIQWRSTQSSKKGRGIAWIDDNGDEKPDRSLSFSATVERRNVVSFGRIDIDEPMEPF